MGIVAYGQNWSPCRDWIMSINYIDYNWSVQQDFFFSRSDASVKLYLPPNLKEEEITKYPLFIQVYGGPGSQLVNERFGVNWGYYLSTRKNIIYGTIDGRGSGYKGDKILHELYYHLGTVEVDDQILVTRYALIFIHNN